MLYIETPSRELYNEQTNKIFTIKGQKLQLEHSLVSISKWEAKWKKPFLSKTPMTSDEFIDYIRCMTLTQNVDPNVYYCLSAENARQISEYINDPMTATTFFEDKSKPKQARQRTITSELVYYWMVALNIPMECQKWHFNRLMTLIRICNIENAPKKKMSKSELWARNKALNDARRKALNTRG